MKNKMLALSTMALLFASCSNEYKLPSEQGKNPNAVNFTLNEIRTKVVNNQFEIGDTISMKATTENGEELKHTTYTYVGGSKFDSKDPIILKNAEVGKVAMSYQARYPQVENFDNAFDFTVETDQSIIGAFEESDLLIATIVNSTAIDLPLTFVHTMANVIIDLNITEDGIASSAKPTDFKVMAQQVAACDIDAMTYVGKGEKVEITPAGSDLSYNVVIAPQQLAINGAFASMNIGDVNLVMENAVAQNFESGKRYQIRWNVDLATGEQSVEVNATIGAWKDGIWSTDKETETPSPTITAITPTSLNFAADATQPQTVNLTISDLGDAEVTAVSNNTHFTTSVSEKTVTVTPTAANTSTSEAITANITISVAGGNSMELSVTQAAAQTTGSTDMPTYPLSVDFTSLGLEVPTLAISTAENPFTTIDGCIVHFAFSGGGVLDVTNPNAPTYKTSTKNAEAIGVVGSGQCLMTITSPKAMTRIDFELFDKTTGKTFINANGLIVNVGGGKMTKGAVGTSGPYWTATPGSETFSLTFKMGNVGIKSFTITE